MSRKKDKIVRIDSNLFDALKDLVNEDVLYDNEGNAKRVHNPYPSAFTQLSDKQLLSVYGYAILKMKFSAEDFSTFLLMNPPGFDAYLIDVLEQKLSPKQSVIIPASKIDDLFEMQLEFNARLVEFQEYQIKENRAMRLFMVRNFHFLKRGLSSLIGTIMETFDLKNRSTYLSDSSKDAYNVLNELGNEAADQMVDIQKSKEGDDH